MNCVQHFRRSSGTLLIVRDGVLLRQPVFMSRFENVTSKILTNDNHFISAKKTYIERTVATTDRILPWINLLVPSSSYLTANFSSRH